MAVFCCSKGLTVWQRRCEPRVISDATEVSNPQNYDVVVLQSLNLFTLITGEPSVLCGDTLSCFLGRFLFVETNVSLFVVSRSSRKPHASYARKSHQTGRQRRLQTKTFKGRVIYLLLVI